MSNFVLLLNKGQNRDEIMAALGLTLPEFETLFAEYYQDAETDQQNKTPLRVFVELVGRKNQLTRDLERLKGQIEKGGFRASQAYVAAVKTQSDILDSLVKVGQDLGLIIKAPDQVLLVNGRDVREMGEDELHTHLQKEIREIMEMANRRKGVGSSTKKSADLIAFPGLDAQREGRVS